MSAGALILEDMDGPWPHQKQAQTGSSDVRVLRDRVKLLWKALTDETRARQGVQERLDRLTASHEQQQDRLLKLEMMMMNAMESSSGIDKRSGISSSFTEPITPVAALVNVRSPVDRAAEGGHRREKPSSYVEAEMVPHRGIGGHGYGVAIGPAGMRPPCNDEPQQWRSVDSANSAVCPGVLGGDGQARVTNFSVVVEKLTVNGGSKSLGMLLGGGDAELPVFVHKVIPGGAVDAQGQIEVGDFIDRVDGTDITELSIKDAYDILRHTGDIVDLTLRRSSLFAANIRSEKPQQRDQWGHPEIRSTPDPFGVSENVSAIYGPREGSPAFSPSPIQKRGSVESTAKHTEPIGRVDDCTRYRNRDRDLPGGSRCKTPTSRSPYKIARRRSKPGQIGEEPTKADLKDKIAGEFMAANPDHECASAVIRNDGGSLGIAIKGGTSTMGPGVYISEISPTGAVGKAGTIKPNDLIVAINGNAVYDEMKKGVLVQLKSGGEIHMVVARKKCKTGGRSPKHTSL